MFELPLGTSRSSPKELSRGSVWHIGRKESIRREWYRAQFNWGMRSKWENVKVEAGGRVKVVRVKVAKGFGCQTQELGLYPVGDREPCMGCKQGSDLVNQRNDPGTLEIGP